MMGRFNKALKDLKSEMKIENMYKQRDIDKQKAEIIELTNKCKHLKKAIAYIKSITQSQ